MGVELAEKAVFGSKPRLTVTPSGPDAKELLMGVVESKASLALVEVRRKRPTLRSPKRFKGTKVKLFKQLADWKPRDEMELKPAPAPKPGSANGESGHHPQKFWEQRQFTHDGAHVEPGNHIQPKVG